MNPRTDTSDDQVPAQHYAAMYVALGWLRGELEMIMMDEVDKPQIRRLLDASSVAEIAKIVGKKEADLDIDFNYYLTERQKHELGGSQYDEPYEKK